MEGHENELAAYHGMPTTGWASEGEWGMSSNTSNASTIMAGIVTLVRSRYPFLSNGQVRHHLRKYATDLGSAGRDDKYGYGPVRADLAEILVRGTDAAGNEEFRTKYVDVSPSNPIGSCEEPWA